MNQSGQLIQVSVPDTEFYLFVLYTDMDGNSFTVVPRWLSGFEIDVFQREFVTQKELKG